MKKIVALVALAGIATAATAQTNGIDVKVRKAGTSTWLDTLDYSALQGSGALNVEVAILYNRASGYGFSGSVHNVVTSNWGSGDVVTLLDRADSAQHPDGRQGRFNFGAQKQQAYTTGADAGTMRISASGNTQNVAAGGISVKQNTPVASGTSFDTSNPALGFRFDISLAERAVGSTHTFNLSTPLASVFNFAIYATDQSTAGTNVTPLSSLILDGAVINAQWTPVPAPGSIALLGLGGLAIGRRRR